MKCIKLGTSEQFKNLKKGDLIIVEWDDYTVKHKENIKKVMAYNIHEIKKDRDEIICKMPENHFFNWALYIINSSGAKEIFLIKQE